jgi:hypothetical protein
MLERNSPYSIFASIDEMLDEAEDALTMRYAEMKDDLKRVVEIARQTGKRSSTNASNVTSKLQKHSQESKRQKELELQKQREIRSFERALHFDMNKFLAKSNVALTYNAPSANEFMEYCQSQPELKEITMEKDLNRMKYTIQTLEGTTLTDPNEIKLYFQNESPEMAREHEMLYRAANQTLFADTILALTSFDGLIRPQLCAGTFVDDCSLNIDLKQKVVHGELFLNISIPDGINGRLNMTGAIADVYFCPSTNELQRRIHFLCPCQELTEIQVTNAAKALAEQFLPTHQSPLLSFKNQSTD